MWRGLQVFVFLLYYDFQSDVSHAVKISKVSEVVNSDTEP